jgi:hypothetical protein
MLALEYARLRASEEVEHGAATRAGPEEKRATTDNTDNTDKKQEGLCGRWAAFALAFCSLFSSVLSV